MVTLKVKPSAVGTGFWSTGAVVLPEVVDSPVTIGDAVITPVGVEFDADGVVCVDGGVEDGIGDAGGVVVVVVTVTAASATPETDALASVYPVLVTVTVTVEESLGSRPVTETAAESFVTVASFVELNE